MNTRTSRVGLAAGVVLALVASLSTQALAKGGPPGGGGGPVTATGGVTCNGVSGTAKFSPPLTRNGNSTTETIKFKLRLSGCSTTGSNVSSITSGMFNITMKSPTGTANNTNSCANATPAAGTVPTTSVGKWKAPKGTKVNMTHLSTTGESWSTGGPNVSVSLPGTGTASNTGTSFAGTDNGTSSSISLTLALTGAQFSAVCAPTTGTGHISKSNVTSGSVTLG